MKYMRLGEKPSGLIMAGKTQYRCIVPYWAKTPADAVRRLFNAGYRGEDLKLGPEEVWMVKNK